MIATTRAALVLFAALGAALAGGCVADVGLPAGARLACASNEECPAGQACSRALGRCLPAVPVESDPPRVDGTPQVVPPVGRAGATFRVTLRVSEELAFAPRVALRLASGDRELAPGAREGLAWTFSYAARDDEPEGAVPLVARLVDVAGNVSEDVSAGALRFDRTSPALAAPPVVTPAVGRAGTTVEVRFAATEPLAEGSVVRVGARAAEAVAAAEGEPRLFRYVVGAADAAGTYDVTATLRDEAGNASADLALGRVRLDFAPPALAAPPVLPARPLRPGELLQVPLAFTEPVTGSPALTLVGAGREVSLERVVTDAAGSTFFRAVAAGDEGAWALVLSGLEDEAGHVAPPATLGEVRVDATPPGLAGPLALADAVAAAGRTAYAAGATLTVAFAATEPVRAPEVFLEMVDGSRRALVAEAASASAPSSPGPFLYSLVVPSDAPEGQGRVTVALEDAAGQRAGPFATGLVTIDRTPPGAARAASVQPTPAGLGRVLAVRVFADEPVASATLDVLAPSGLAFDPPLVSGATVEWTRVVTAADAAGAGPVDLAAQARLVDLAGNEGFVPLAAAGAIDAVPPALLETQEDLTPRGTFRDGAELSLAFTASEPLGTPPVVRLGRRPLAPDAGSGPTRWTYATRAAAGTDPEGPAAITVALVDDAGNRTDAARGDVTLDYTPPGLASATVSYVGAATNPLPQVSRAAAGTRVVVGVVADEPLDPALVPRLSLDCGGAAVVRDLPAASVGERAVTFDWTVLASAPDGACTPRVAWRDLAGNERADATFRAPAIALKTSAPTLLVDQDQVTYLRSPWGTDTPEALGAHTMPAGPYFALAPADPLSPAGTLPAGTFTTAAGAPARLRFWADAGRVTLLGFADPNADGTWPRARLASVDAPAVWVTALDDAGNESAPVRVRDAEWVATPRPSSFGTNPHRADAAARAGDTREPAREFPLTSPATLGARDGVAAVVRSEPFWRVRSDPGPASSLPMGLAAYDAVRGRLVHLAQDTGYAPETWEWDGRVWLRFFPARSLPETFSALALVFDAGRGRVVALGYAGGIAAWEWDGADWTVRTAAAGRTPEFALSGAAYDSARGRVVIFGNAVGACTSETWEWDGSAFARRTPAASPPARYGARMANDSRRGVVVLMGGLDCGNYRALNDLWEWDGSTWTQRANVPGDVTSRTIAYDPVRGATVYVSRVITRNTLWAWDGAAWAAVPTKGMPTAFPVGGEFGLDGLMAWDDAQRAVVVLARTKVPYELVGDSWVARTRGNTQSKFVRATMAWDDARREAVSFGGYGNFSFTPSNVTLTWNGSGWNQLSPATSPPVRDGQAVAYDPVRQRVVMFGGVVNLRAVDETWEWDGTTWGQRTIATRPPARSGHAMAWDGVRSRVMVFGGVSASAARTNDQWELDGTTWARRTPAGPLPSARSGARLAWDAQRRRVVMFGGETATAVLDDTWEWDGTAWTDRTPAGPRPAARSGAGLAYDEARGRVVLHGGVTPTGSNFADTWEWDGTAWSLQADGTLPAPARARHTMAWDGARGRVVLDAGVNASGTVADTREWDAGLGRRPGVQLTASFASAGFAPEELVGARLRGACAGAFGTGTGMGGGAALQAWVTGGPGQPAGGWRTVATNGTPIGATDPVVPTTPDAELSWRAVDAAEARWLVSRADRLVAARCVPAGDNTVTVQAAVAADALEVRLRYRLP